jgi:outer membrane murein-binding lipoprotein Lpp
MSSGSVIHVDRRTTLRWLAAAVATETLLAGCDDDRHGVAQEHFVDLGVARPPDGTVYGTDPDLVTPMVPWQKTMTETQLDVVAALADVILPASESSPAASDVGVQHFIDEWVSAPYEAQQIDRPIILEGLVWLEQESRARFGRSFVNADDEQLRSILDQIAFRDRVVAGKEDAARFFERFRHLTMSAYYATAAGIREIGYIGNMPVSGAYPGPTDAALKHLGEALLKLGLN